MQPAIRKGLSVLEEINTTEAALQHLEAQKKKNEDFEYEVEFDQYNKFPIPAGTFITNCKTCSFTCHHPCGISRNEEKIRCDAMEDGMCTVCPKKCVWSVHINTDYRWEITRVREKRTFQELKSKYEAALKQQKMSLENIIWQLGVEYAQVQWKVIDMLITVTKCLMRLAEIALRPDPLTTPDYIDLLIQAEKHEPKDGYIQRIKQLEEVKRSAVIVQKMADGMNLTAKENAMWEKMKSEVKGIFSDFNNL